MVMAFQHSCVAVIGSATAQEAPEGRDLRVDTQDSVPRDHDDALVLLLYR
jgi:transcriptional regulator of met regulon